MKDDDERLAEALRDALSPEAVAAIAACLRCARTDDASVDRQVEWFRGQLVAMLGGRDEHARLAAGSGL